MSQKELVRQESHRTGQARITYDELMTAVAEVEMILNSRPLSYVSTKDLEEPLTLSHLLMGLRVLNLPDPSYVEPEDDNWHSMSKETLSNRAQHLSMTNATFLEAMERRISPATERMPSTKGEWQATATKTT